MKELLKDYGWEKHNYCLDDESINTLITLIICKNTKFSRMTGKEICQFAGDKYGGTIAQALVTMLNNI